jgi:hypothetical protein
MAGRFKEGGLSYVIGESIPAEQRAKLQEIGKTHRERISSKVQAIFDRSPGLVVDNEEARYISTGKSSLIARGKDGVFSEVRIMQKDDSNDNEHSQTLVIIFDPSRQNLQVELTQEGRSNPDITLEYDSVDHAGNVSIVGDAMIRSLYRGQNMDTGENDLGEDGISMYSFSKKTYDPLSGIELTVNEDEQRDELVIRDNPYTEGEVRFPLRKLNMYRFLQGFEEQLLADRDARD